MKKLFFICCLSLAMNMVGTSSHQQEALKRVSLYPLDKIMLITGEKRTDVSTALRVCPKVDQHVYECPQCPKKERFYGLIGQPCSGLENALSIGRCNKTITTCSAVS